MPGKHTEQAFEDAIEHSLISTGGWVAGDPNTFDRERALHPADLFAFSHTEVGTHKAKDDDAQLSEIIEVLNERFGTEFKQDDQILFDQFIAAAKLDDEVVQRAKANPLDNFALAMKGKMEGLMIDRMDQNEEIVTRYLNDPQFQDVAFRLLVRRIYDEIRAGGRDP